MFVRTFIIRSFVRTFIRSFVRTFIRSYHHMFKYVNVNIKPYLNTRISVNIYSATTIFMGR